MSVCEKPLKMAIISKQKVGITYKLKSAYGLVLETNVHARKDSIE